MNEVVHATVDGCGVARERERARRWSEQEVGEGEGSRGEVGQLVGKMERERERERDGGRETEAHSTLPR